MSFIAMVGFSALTYYLLGVRKTIDSNTNKGISTWFLTAFEKAIKGVVAPIKVSR